MFNPRTYQLTHIPAVVQGEGRGGPLPRVFVLLRTFALYCLCASLLPTQIHMPRHVWEHTLRNKMNNDTCGADGHCYGFAWVKWSWMFGDSYFSFQKQILFAVTFYIVQKWTKDQCGNLKKFQDFCPRDIESCHLAAARRVKLWRNCNIFGLTDTLALFANKARFFQI